MRRHLIIVAAALVAACATRQMSSDIQPGDAENAIRVANSAFMNNVRSANFDALVNSYYAPDAVLMPPETPALHGRESIRQFFNAVNTAGAADIAITTDNVIQSCDMATEVGHYDFAMTPRNAGAATTHELGKYLVTWRKIDGQWRVVADMFSANAPAPH